MLPVSRIFSDNRDHWHPGKSVHSRNDAGFPLRHQDFETVGNEDCALLSPR